MKGVKAIAAVLAAAFFLQAFGGLSPAAPLAEPVRIADASVDGEWISGLSVDPNVGLVVGTESLAFYDWAGGEVLLPRVQLPEPMISGPEPAFQGMTEFWMGRAGEIHHQYGWSTYFYFGSGSESAQGIRYEAWPAVLAGPVTVEYSYAYSSGSPHAPAHGGSYAVSNATLASRRHINPDGLLVLSRDGYSYYYYAGPYYESTTTTTQYWHDYASPYDGRALPAESDPFEIALGPDVDTYMAVRALGGELVEYDDDGSTITTLSLGVAADRPGACGRSGGLVRALYSQGASLMALASADGAGTTTVALGDAGVLDQFAQQDSIFEADDTFHWMTDAGIWTCTPGGTWSKTEIGALLPGTIESFVPDLLGIQGARFAAVVSNGGVQEIWHGTFDGSTWMSENVTTAAAGQTIAKLGIGTTYDGDVYVYWLEGPSPLEWYVAFSLADPSAAGPTWTLYR